MKVLYALLCEDAHDRSDGRLDVHGVFHQLYAPGFPARQDRFTLAMAVEWEPHELGRIDFAIDLLDPGNAPALSITGHTDVSPRQPLMGPPQTRMLMPLENIVFPAEGTYLFELKVGETRLPLAPLHLIEDAAMR
ncbi:MAG TPA: hypothetical protein VHG91_02330 [Longimicrobium sp.]|nr:hypothetical protein [Longimicrobium sp.]